MEPDFHRRGFPMPRAGNPMVDDTMSRALHHAVQQPGGRTLMLVLTPVAIEVVSAITSASVVPDAAGVRIAAVEFSPEGVNLAAELVDCPADGDQVLAQRGARVYLDRTAASYLDDKTLTAEVDEDGRPRFRLFEPGTDDWPYRG
jgi:iron-sulfur cluster assembly protein